MLTKSTTRKKADRRNRRLDQRRTSPELSIRFDGRSYKTLDWSIGGFSIKHYEGSRREDDEFPVELACSLQGKKMTALIMVSAVRRDRRTGFFAAHFTRFYDDAFSTLEQIAMRRLRDQ